MPFLDPDEGHFVDPDHMIDPDEAPKGASSLLNFFTGSPRRSYEQSKISKIAAPVAKEGVGALEAGVNFGTGTAALGMGWPGLINDVRSGQYKGFDESLGNTMNRYTYQPRSEEGQRNAEAIGKVIQEVGIPLAGVAHALPSSAHLSPIPSIKGKMEAPEVTGRPIADTIAAEKFAKEQPQGTLFVDPDGIASENLGTKITDPYTEVAKTQQAEELANVAKQVEQPSGEQIGLFGEENLPHDENPAGQLTRQPEQIPIDFSFKDPDVPQSDLSSSDANEKWYTGSPKELTQTRTLEERSGNTNADAQKAGPGHYITLNEDMARMYGGKEGNLYSVENPFENPFDFNQVIGRISNETRYNQLVENLGSRSEANKALKANGYDAITFTDPRGNKIANIFNAKPVKLEGSARIVKEYSEPFELIPLEERPVPEDTLMSPKSPENIQAKEVARNKVDILRKVNPELNLKEWNDVNTREEAMALSLTYKDISGSLAAKAGRNMTAGLHGTTIMSGHPMLRYIRKLANDARANIAKMSQDYITNKKDGLVTSIQKLSSKDAVPVMELLNEGDRQQFRATESTMEKLGFNDAQKNVVRSFQKAGDAELAQWNAKRTELGFKPITKREGWLPGVFKGGYKTLVWDRESNIVGMIAQDTKWQQKAAREYYLKNYPGATIGTTVHNGLGGFNKVDMFSGVNDALALIAKEDPKMALLLEKSNNARKLINNDLFNVGKHELQKRGISGNEGNRPWLSKEQNAKDTLRSMVDYFETAFEHHELQPLLHEINKTVSDVSFPHENVKQYLQQYGDHIAGKTGKMGTALNNVIDTSFDAFGMGTSIPLKGLSSIKAGMSRMFMGYNPAFMAAQAAQPFQMAFPLAGMFANRMGMSQHQVASAMGRGSVWATAENMARWFDKPQLAIAPQYIKEAIEYATERGLYAFNELELAHQAIKNKYVRGFNQAADFTISTGDKMTKLPTFLGFVELFKDGGIDNKTAYALAEKATESSMVAYHPWERPMMYQKMGVIGQFAGGLTTFKHANINLQAKLAQEAFGEQKNIKPLAMSAAAMLLFAGITGLPAYGELDRLYSKVSELAYGEPKTIREDFLQRLPELIKSGALSAASNLNLQAKWSSADLTPDTVGKALSPHLAGAYTIGEAAARYATDPNTINRNALIMQLTPGGLKGFTENAVMKDEQGRVLNNQGLPKFSEPRSEANWKLKKYTGVGLLNETIESTDTFKDRQAQTYKDKQIKDLSNKIKGAYIGNNFARGSTLLEEYKTLAGPDAMKSLIDEIGNKTLPIDKNMGDRQRLQGVPNSYKGVKKYENYNDGS